MFSALLYSRGNVEAYDLTVMGALGVGRGHRLANGVVGPGEACQRGNRRAWNVGKTYNTGLNKIPEGIASKSRSC